MVKVQPIILAGGTGSRLWPLSKESYPKQMLRLIGETTLLQTSLLRVNRLANILPPVVVVREAHRFIALTQIEELDGFDDTGIILEPVGKNTAPAICGAAEYCKLLADDAVLLVLPVDHVVTQTDKFIQAIQQAAKLAIDGLIVTFGIKPTRPETGYGYIERGEDGRVASFKEKPDLPLAKKYIARGRYLWNSGMFAFSIKTYMQQMHKFAPRIVNSMAMAVANGTQDGRFFCFEKEAMSECPSESIDYALMEKTDRAVVIDTDIGWSDIGSWQALWDVLDKDACGNVTKGDVLVEDTKNCLVRGENLLVAVVGVEDAVIIETADAVLVAPLSRSEDVKKVVGRLQEQKRKEFSLHRTIYRPWGSSTILVERPGLQIKRITVLSGEKMSSQVHGQRHEHWVVIKGTAKVTSGDREVLLGENQSISIPAGTRHELENTGDHTLELIEVQTGDYPEDAKIIE